MSPSVRSSIASSALLLRAARSRHLSKHRRQQSLPPQNWIKPSQLTADPPKKKCNKFKASDTHPTACSCNIAAHAQLSCAYTRLPRPRRRSRLRLRSYLQPLHLRLFLPAICCASSLKRIHACARLPRCAKASTAPCSTLINTRVAAAASSTPRCRAGLARRTSPRATAAAGGSATARRGAHRGARPAAVHAVHADGLAAGGRSTVNVRVSAQLVRLVVAARAAVQVARAAAAAPLRLLVFGLVVRLARARFARRQLGRVHLGRGGVDEEEVHWHAEQRADDGAQDLHTVTCASKGLHMRVTCASHAPQKHRLQDVTSTATSAGCADARSRARLRLRGAGSEGL